jgi:hypothetical protein
LTPLNIRHLKVIFTIDESFPVLAEIAARGAFWSLMHFIYQAQRDDTLLAVH